MVMSGLKWRKFTGFPSAMLFQTQKKKNLDDFYLSFYGDVPEVNELVN